MNNSQSVVSLVLGIIGIVFAFLVPIVGIILGIIAVVLANKERKVEKNGQNTGGFICGIVAIILSVVMWIVNIVIISAALSMFM